MIYSPRLRDPRNCICYSKVTFVFQQRASDQISVR